MKTVTCVFVLFLLCESSADAGSTEADSVSQVDTVSFQPLLDHSPATQVVNPVNFEDHLYQGPTVALFKSMLVPGLGQLGNRRYVKAVVIIGLETWFIGSAIHYGGQAADYKEQHDKASDIGTRNIYYGLYEDHRDERNKFTWFAGITIFASMFDAYVDAHLSGSPSSKRNDRFGWRALPDRNGGVSAVFSYTF